MAGTCRSSRRLPSNAAGLAEWHVFLVVPTSFWSTRPRSGRPDPTHWSLMSFKVNDRVVYPHHGAAVIKKKEKRDFQGETREYFVLEMVHGDLMLSVPVDMAEEVGM